MKPAVLRHEFVQSVPEQLDEGVLYVSMTHATALHKCCCGCGTEVVTPLTPTDWALTFNGETVSLDPSIGNWSFACRSHYWIRQGRVRWAAQLSDREISMLRARQRLANNLYYGGYAPVHGPTAEPTPPRRSRRRWWQSWRPED